MAPTPHIAEHNQGKLILLVEHAVLTEVEVRDPHALRAVIVLARQIHEQVSRPSQQLVLQTRPQRHDGRVLSQLSKLHHVRARLITELALQPARPGVWHEGCVAVEVARGLVVLGVAEAPRVEGDEEERVHDQAHGPIELLGAREGAVAALVGQDPHAREDEALECGVGSPGGAAQVEVREERNVGNGDVC